MKMSDSSIHVDLANNEAVISALRAGEEDVFDAVYRYYFRRLCAFCSQYIREQAEIEEIAQDTMIWLWENRNNLRTNLSLKSLLFTITKNKALNRLSHFEIRRKVHQEIVEKYQSKFENPDFYCGKELFYLYKEALAQLSPTFRETYEMSRDQQFTHNEIAEKLNVSIQTVNYRIGQALKILRLALKDYLPILIFYCSILFRWVL